MKMILTIASREFRSLFLSPLAWTVLAILQFILASARSQSLDWERDPGSSSFLFGSDFWKLELPKPGSQAGAWEPAQTIIASGWGLEELMLLKKSMEDIFIALTKGGD